MSRPCRPARVLAQTLTVAALGAVAAPPAPAAALPPSSAVSLAAEAAVWVKSRTATSATVCARGAADGGTATVARWRFTAVGTTGTWTDERAGQTLAETCHTTTTGGSAAGATAYALTYTAVGGEPVAVCWLAVAWDPGSTPNWLVGQCVADTTPGAVLGGTEPTAETP